MPKHIQSADVEALRREFTYDKKRGILIRTSTGKPAGCQGENSGNRVQTKQGKLMARSIIASIVSGEFVPSVKVLHKNGDIYDDRFENLQIIPKDKHICGNCREILPRDKFFHRERSPSGLESYCKECKLSTTRDARLIYEHKKRLNLFGLTDAQFDIMAKAQNHACAICRSPQTAKRLAIDHCHETGKVRGLLCHKCNTALGKFNDDPQRVIRAAQYLLGKLDYRTL